MRNAQVMTSGHVSNQYSEELMPAKKQRSFLKMLLLAFAVVLVGCAVVVVKSSHGGDIMYHITSTDLITWAGIYLAINEHYSS